MKVFKLITTAALSGCLLGVSFPAYAGIVRGDCSIFQEQEDGIPEFNDCDVKFQSPTFEIEMIRSGRNISIPIAQIIAVDATTYTVEDFKARTAFALTFQSNHPDGFDILTFRMKSKRAVTVLAALRQLLKVDIKTDL